MAKNLIGSEWVDASSGKVIEVYNPATNELIDTVPDTTKEDCDRAVEAAKKGQKEWEKKPIHERASILMKFVKLVEEHKDELAKLLSDETGKPISEAIGEIANVSIGIPAFCEKAKHEYGKVIPAGVEPGQEHHIQYTEQYPLGVVVAVIPFNFPSDLFCQKVPPALLMGNSVILKPSAHNPLTLTKYVELLIEAGVPGGVINLLNGAGGEAVQSLAENPGVALVTLTGSTIAGAETMAKCAKNITHVTLELGGNDAFILCKDGDVDLAVKEIVWGRLYNTGQVCCASKRFIIHKDVKEEFLNKLVETFKGIPVKMPSDPEAKLGCLISEQAAINVEKQVNDTVAAGAKLVFGGRRKGAFYEPTILDGVTKDMDVAKDMEIFGPVVPIIEFEDLDEAIEIANQSSYGLCGCVFSRDMKTCQYVADKLECGGAVISGASFFRPFEMPFGGWKHSGIGNEGVMTTFEEMSRTKTFVLKNII